jgi:hypothetical protein
VNKEQKAMLLSMQVEQVEYMRSTTEDSNPGVKLFWVDYDPPITALGRRMRHRIPEHFFAKDELDAYTKAKASLDQFRKDKLK